VRDRTGDSAEDKKKIWERCRAKSGGKILRIHKQREGTRGAVAQGTNFGGSARKPGGIGRRGRDNRERASHRKKEIGLVQDFRQRGKRVRGPTFA